jgi:hypothetical protein
VIRGTVFWICQQIGTAQKRVPHWLTVLIVNAAESDDWNFSVDSLKALYDQMVFT